ncbi:MAG: carbohydrate kinase [Planctomycetes bacterium]|nr:carbohydrate kinase [Planctomycetota bacterium]
MELPTVLGIGELLWDCFPDRRLPGGAPANFAFHAQQLGARAATVTRVGSDQLGDELCEFLEAQGLDVGFVQKDPVHSTGTVTVQPDDKGTKYTFLPDSAWDFLEPDTALLNAVQSAKAISFGTLAQRCPISRATIHVCLAAAPVDCQIVYDVNLRPPFYERDWIERSIQRATCVKLNDDETKILSRLLETNTQTELQFAEHLLKTFHKLDLVCVTRGSRGCMAVDRHECIEFPGIPVTVVDTVGAGDAFTAALIQTRLDKWPLTASANFANHVGALVASHPGAMPLLREELKQLRLTLTSLYDLL